MRILARAVDGCCSLLIDVSELKKMWTTMEHKKKRRNSAERMGTGNACVLRVRAAVRVSVGKFQRACSNQ